MVSRIDAQGFAYSLDLGDAPEGTDFATTSSATRGDVPFGPGVTRLAVRVSRVGERLTVEAGDGVRWVAAR